MNPLDQTFSALGDTTRRQILAQLRNGETSLSALAAPLAMSQTAVSKHVRVLQDAGLVRVEKRGRTRHCQLEAHRLQAATDWLEDYREFWQDQLSSLAQYLAEENRSS